MNYFSKKFFRNKYLFYSTLTLGILVFVVSNLFIVNNLSQPSISPELTSIKTSPYGKGNARAIAASCGFDHRGAPPAQTDPNENMPCTTTITCNGTSVTKTGTSYCGGTCIPTDYNCPDVPACTNGAINAPSCDLCPAGRAMFGGNCEPVCSNGATNAPTCNICPGGQQMINGICTNACISTDACGVSKTGYINSSGQCVVAQAPTCSAVNACGQTTTGYQCASGCTATANNNQCITDWKVSSNSINPNGSVEFSWKTPPNVGSRCGFVDLTTPTSRAIPGLQNLDPTVDRVRITNIQTTTRFCLVCQFYNLTTGINIGEAQAHQWIRVIRIGES